MTELTGGYINRVLQQNDTVTKYYEHDEMIGVPAARRLRNETRALQSFGSSLAPALLHVGENYLVQEFLEGVSYETRARNGEEIFKTSGKLLRSIHRPYVGNIAQMKQYYDQRFAKAMNKTTALRNHQKLEPTFLPSWDHVYSQGLACLHGDFWLGNVIGTDNTAPKAIDWELAHVGSVYEDLAIAQLWIVREFENSEEFWDGYEYCPHPPTLAAFLQLRCLELLSTATIERFEEEDIATGFYHNKVQILREQQL